MMTAAELIKELEPNTEMRMSEHGDLIHVCTDGVMLSYEPLPNRHSLDCSDMII